MTLTGTNSYLVRAGAASVVIDPGPLLPPHLQRLATEDVVLILVTHRHPDHTDGVDWLVERTGAPARAIAPEWCRNAPPLEDGEVLEVAGTRLEVVATPGHTSDSVSFVAPDAGVVFTGDTLLGGSSTIIDHPDGTLADYLASLEQLVAIGSTTPLRIQPGHGDPGDDLASEAQRILCHRHERLEQVRQVVRGLGEGGQIDVERVLDIVYEDAPARVRDAARVSLLAQLRYLETHN